MCWCLPIIELKNARWNIEICIYRRQSLSDNFIIIIIIIIIIMLLLLSVRQVAYSV